MSLDLLTPLRQAKHQMFLARRALRSGAEELGTAALRARSRVAPYRYDPERYRRHIGDLTVPRSRTFPTNHLELPVSLPHDAQPGEAPDVIWCLWTAANPLTPQRSACLDALRRTNTDLPLELVTEGDLGSVVRAGHPLHPAWDHLSAVHRSDYLRAYLMYHHGGIYVDIKKVDKPLSDLLVRLRSEPSAWLSAPAEQSPLHTSPASGPLGRDQRLHYAAAPSQWAFAFRPRTLFAAAWLDEVHRRLDYYSSALTSHPAQDPFGMTAGYPVVWDALLGSVFHPLSLKYRDRCATVDGYEIDYGAGYR